MASPIRMSAAAAAEDRHKLGSIQAMRGVAALAVVLFHFGYANSFFEKEWPGVAALFEFGYTGVTMFFVISGFIIPLSMRRRNYCFPAGMPKFVWSRIIRIEPVCFAVLLFIIALQVLSAKLRGAAAAPIDLPSVILQVTYLAPWFHVDWLNGVMWTLALELQYYLLMCLFAPLLLDRSPRSIALFLVATALVAVLVDDRRLVLPYLPAFAVGFCAFLLHERRISTLMFAACAVFFSLLVGYKIDAPSALVALISGPLIFYTPLARIPFVCGLGTISYSLYLIHVPVGVRVIQLFDRLGTSASVAGMIGALGVSFIAAYALWRFIENPMSGYAKRWQEAHELRNVQTPVRVYQQQNG